jgi:hypothetical protein
VKTIVAAVAFGPRGLRRLAGVLVVLAALSWAALRVAPPAAPLWNARGVALAHAGQLERSAETLERAARRGGRGHADWHLGVVHQRSGDPVQARQAFLRSTLAPDPAHVARGYQGLSALHLAGTEFARRGSRAVDGAAVATPAAAARAAMAGLRLIPGDAGLAWNLGVARRMGGFPEPETAPGAVDPAVRRTLRSALSALEARNLRESLGVILRELESQVPPAPSEGPPW